VPNIKHVYGWCLAMTVASRASAFAATFVVQLGGYVPVPFSMTVRFALIVEANWFIRNAAI
jgi:hypothetical protein